MIFCSRITQFSISGQARHYQFRFPCSKLAVIPVYIMKDLHIEISQYFPMKSNPLISNEIVRYSFGEEITNVRDRQVNECMKCLFIIARQSYIQQGEGVKCRNEKD